jgi:CMP-N,N'-diacetyllegionaminic acid synthase
MMTSIIGIIPARGGSKGIPRKNIKTIAGRPLIDWTIGAALDSRSLDRVIVSTDDAEIARVAEDCGAEVPFIRPKKIASDSATSFSVVDHAVTWLINDGLATPDSVMLLQPTSPLRTAEDICGAITLRRKMNAPAVVSVCETGSHPCLIKKIDKKGRLENYSQNCPEFTRRQDLPKAYILNGALYLNSWAALSREQNFIPEGTGAYIMPPERSIDIDTPLDFALAELLLKRVKKSC